MLWTLYAIADEVVQQPLGRQQAIISLGRRRGAQDVRELAGQYFGGDPPLTVKLCIERVEGRPTGAEAVLRLFSPEGRLWELFERLLLWRRAGLLEDATVTLENLSRVRTRAGREHHVVLAYDSLSDGEQMLLGRMALLFLLQGMDGGLLLLDEPETHFNDVWKREIVDIVDDNVLKSTRVQVLVATHTSIALTDVFASEITLLRRGGQRTEAAAAPLPTFGEEPGEIMVRLFGAPETIGERAAEWLDELIRQKWTPERRGELESIIAQIGAGYYRSELRAALKKLKDAASH